MENTIKIKQLNIGDELYQFRYESANRKIEVSKQKMVRPYWWSNKKKSVWIQLSLEDMRLYIEVVKFQFYHTNRELIQEATGNQSLLDIINKIEKENTIQIK